MAFDAAATALGDLVLGECGQEASGRPAFLVGLFGECGPDLFDGGQTQLGEQQLDAGGIDGIGRFHAAPPSSRGRCSAHERRKLVIGGERHKLDGNVGMAV